MEFNLSVFIAVCLAVSISPGPAVLYIVARTIDQGVRAGLASIAGISLGGAVHLLLAAFGVAAIASASPTSLLVLQMAGACYLIWLGFQRAKRSRRQSGDIDLQHEALMTVFRQGVIVNLTNPKTVLFLLAFLPQFVDEAAGPVWRQMLLLGFVFIAVAASTDTGYALIAGRIRGRLRNGGAPPWAGYFAGGVYVLLGAIGLADAVLEIG